MVGSALPANGFAMYPLRKGTSMFRKLSSQSERQCHTGEVVDLICMSVLIPCR